MWWTDCFNSQDNCLWQVEGKFSIPIIITKDLKLWELVQYIFLTYSFVEKASSNALNLKGKERPEKQLTRNWAGFLEIQNLKFGQKDVAKSPKIT